MRLAVGDRVQPDKALGTIEKIRTSKEGYLVAEILWDTGASARSLSTGLDPDYEIPPVWTPSDLDGGDDGPQLSMGVPCQPLKVVSCLDCRRRWLSRKALRLGAETVCGGCATKLSPGPTWTVTFIDGRHKDRHLDAQSVRKAAA